MKPTRICKYILASSLWLVALCSAFAQQQEGVALDSVASDSTLVTAPKPTRAATKWLSGMSVSVNALGALLANLSSYGHYEASLRLNIRQTYFPIIEVGIGVCSRDQTSTQTNFETRAPYVRLGADLNLARDKRSGNRIFLGARYGFTHFKFDLTQAINDPIWGTHLPLDYRGQTSTAHWGELVFGLEAKIWKNFHIGWTARYHKRIAQLLPAFGQAWYVPGYGKNDTYAFGGSFNLIFDL